MRRNPTPSVRVSQRMKRRALLAAGGAGFVKELRRPGGNVTGVLTRPEVVDKVVELARDAFPKAQRFALLVHDPDPAHKDVVARFTIAAQRFRFEPLIVSVSQPSDLERAFHDMAARKADVLFPANLVFSTSHMREIVDRSLKAKLPLVTSQVEGVATGGVLAYGTRREENYRRAAALVDKILRGASPAELPVEQPGHVALVVNQKTAKAIGVRLPPSVLLRADRVIE